MKVIKLLLLLLILSFGVSCDKEEPYSLAADLQNGIWHIVPNQPSQTYGTVLKFNGTNHTYYFICTSNTVGIPSICSSTLTTCISDPSIVGYTLDSNVLTTVGSSGKIHTTIIEIQGDILTFYSQAQEEAIYERKETLAYPECN